MIGSDTVVTDAPSEDAAAAAALIALFDAAAVAHDVVKNAIARYPSGAHGIVTTLAQITVFTDVHPLAEQTLRTWASARNLRLVSDTAVYEDGATCRSLDAIDDHGIIGVATEVARVQWPVVPSPKRRGARR